MPASRWCSSTIGALLIWRRAGVRVANRRRWPAVATATLVDTARLDVRAGAHAVGRRERARFRDRIPHAAAPARDRHARNVLSPQQGAGQRAGRRRQGDAPAATTAMRLEIVHETRYRY